MTVLLLTIRDRKIEAVLKEGLEWTLSQIRQLVGRVEPNGDGGYSIVRKRGDTVKLVVQHLDSPEDTYPSFDTLADAHFTGDVLGDVAILSNWSERFGRTEEAKPVNRPVLASYKATFIPGGLVLAIQSHHFTNGIFGWQAYVTLLSESCYAIANKTKLPYLDRRCLDRTPYGSFLGFDRQPSPFPAGQSPSKDEILGSALAPQPQISPHLKSLPLQSLIFHLPKSKGAELKKHASPTDGSSRISTYNATCALMWRVFCKIREPVYKPGLDFIPLFGTGVSLAKHYRDVGIPDQLQGSLQFDITSAGSPLPQFTLAEVISEVPLSKLAVYTRQLSDSVTLEMLAGTLQKLAHFPAEELSISVPSFPLMALYVTDWRPAQVAKLDFGFGDTIGFRFLFGEAQRGQGVVYPPRKGPAGDDEGIEITLTFEADLVPQLLEDPLWSKYFEFRGVDIWDEESLRKARSKL